MHARLFTDNIFIDTLVCKIESTVATSKPVVGCVGRWRILKTLQLLSEKELRTYYMIIKLLRRSLVSTC